MLFKSINKSATRLVGSGFLALMFALGFSSVAEAATVHITGTVTDQNGLGVGSVSVSATPLNGGNTNGSVVTSPTDGSYDMSVDSGHAYDVHFNPAPNSGLSAFSVPNYGVSSTNQTLNVQLSNIIAPPVTHIFTGTIQDNSGRRIQNVSVRLVDGGGEQKGVATTDSNGNFSGSALAGNWYVKLTCGNNNCEWNGSGNQPLFELTSTLALVNLASGNASGLSFQLNLASITVNVVDSNNAPVDGELQAMGTGTTSVTTSQGQANFTGRTATNTGTDNGSRVISAPQGMVYAAYTSSYSGQFPSDYPFNGSSSLCFWNGLSKSCNQTSVTVDSTSTVLFRGSLGAPVGLTAASPTKQPALTWTAVSGADHYDVYRGGTKIAYTSLTSYQDTAAPDGTHSYAVKAANLLGNESANSNTISVLVDNTGPMMSSATISPTPMNQNETSTLTALYTIDPTGLDRAEYFEGIDPGQGAATSMSLAGPTATTTVSGLTPGLHTLLVRARDGLGNWSILSSIDVAVKLPAPASLTSASPTNPVVLTWAAVVGADHYDIYRDGGITPVGSITVATFTDGGLTFEGSHNYIVRAVDNDGLASDPSNSVTVFLDATAPSVDSISWTANPLLPGQYSTLSASISDNLSSNIQLVTYAINGGGAQPMTFDTGSSTWKASFGSSLAQGTYSISVVATDAAGNVSIAASTQLTILLPAPTGLNGTTPTNNAPVLTWNSVPTTTSYRVWRQDTATGINTQVGTSTDTNFTDVYQPGVYNYTIVAVNGTIATSSASMPFQVAVTNTQATHSNNIMAQGQSEVVPAFGTDNLPGLISGNATRATFDFNIGYPGGVFNIARPLTFTFNSGGRTLFITSTSIDWLVISGINNSQGTFQGLASAELDNATTTGLPFTVIAADGKLTSPASAGNFKLTVYTNSSRTTILYSVNGSLTKGKVKIN